MTPIETPVEWLEARSFQRTDAIPSDGRIPFQGGWTTLAQIKSDHCRCRNESHMGAADAYRFAINHPEYMPPLGPLGDSYDYAPRLDPYDVAVKRGSPA